MFVALSFVLLFSNLGHKESRFLYPILPLFNLSAATQIVRVLQNRWKSLTRLVMACLVVASIGMMAVVSSTMVWVSMHNYPGGVALQKLHAIEGFPKWHSELSPNTTNVNYVHIGVYPAMTGVSRFGEHGEPWKYSKVQNNTSLVNQKALDSMDPKPGGETLIHSIGKGALGALNRKVLVL